MSWPCRIYNLKRSDKECEKKHQYPCLTDEQQSCKEKWFVKRVKAERRRNTEIHGAFLSVTNIIILFFQAPPSVTFFLAASLGAVQPAAVYFNSATNISKLTGLTNWHCIFSWPATTVFTLKSISKGCCCFFSNIAQALLLIIHMLLVCMASCIAWHSFVLFDFMIFGPEMPAAASQLGPTFTFEAGFLQPAMRAASVLLLFNKKSWSL